MESEDRRDRTLSWRGKACRLPETIGSGTGRGMGGLWGVQAPEGESSKMGSYLGPFQGSLA